MPKSDEKALELITKHGFRSINSVMEQLVYPHLGRVLRLTGNLMSAKESFDEKRADFDSMAFDQLLNGVYKTVTNDKQIIDPMTGKKTTKHFKEILRDENGNLRREGNPMEGTGIVFDAFRITAIKYPQVVESQIEAQRKAIMEVETARANAKKAEQDAKTIEMKGKADVMLSKYEKEQEKVKAIVEAQQQKEVAELHAAKELAVAKLMKMAAKEEKERQILLGQGESERKKLVMNADGALAQKLEAWKEVNSYYAKAMKDYKGQWVPNVVMSGGQNGQNVNAAQSLLDLFMVKTARDLSLDMSVPSGNITKPRKAR
jgi:regulator of protease activity HflC (stomatin/prohibitin superfamily)